MALLEISIQYRVIIGISAMVLLFSSFLIAFISHQRKKIKYHKDVQAMQDKQKQELISQNIVLEKRVTERTAEIHKQNETLREALSELKTSQLQLIQKEKMASLGELTAGIAHEIQNPLNFVNNFSELSNELIDEMTAGIEKGNIEEVKTIARDIKQNLEKINHHGKRADAIVKGMLQHSRSSASAKELTDLNKLVDEYLRLTYHGLRAKDKSFNASFKTEFDEALEKVNIVPQDIGRVILNLITNAFYAVQQKKEITGSGLSVPGKVKIHYEPTVMVTTKKLNSKVQITVKDNGNGIPGKVRDKIFQPFFTTKPAGQGTGLGLSLSYEIVKAHGGELMVETKEGEGSEFIIILPM
jgi:signal transduction histidine kinase